MTHTVQATGPLLSHSLKILFHMPGAWPAEAAHQATKWNQDWCSPVSHRQHTPESVFIKLS